MIFLYFSINKIDVQYLILPENMEKNKMIQYLGGKVVEEQTTISTVSMENFTTNWTNPTNSSQSFANQSHPLGQLANSSNDVYIVVGLCIALAVIVSMVIGVIVYRKRNGNNLHLYTERPINQSLERSVDVSLEQSADRDNQEMHEDNKANTSATLLLGADADTSV